MRVALLAAALAAVRACELHSLPGQESHTKFDGVRKGAVPTTRIDADLLIPGRGEPIRNATIVFNTTIQYAGPRLPADGTAAVRVPVVMPGLFDTHTHFSGSSCNEAWGKITPPQPVFGDPEAGWYPLTFERFACAIKDLNHALMAGVTSVREVGGTYGQPLSHLEISGLYPAPHFHYASRAIGMTGGHGDLQRMPLGVEFGGDSLSFGALCDGPDECIKRTREQIRMEADVIKIMASGGVLSAFDQPTDQELSPREVRAITEEARRSRRAVAAHAHGIEGILSSIENGVYTIEHGSYMNATAAKMMAAKGMQYHPTCAITQSFNLTVKPPYYDDLQWQKGRDLLKAHRTAVFAAIEANVTIATGTDCPAGDCTQAGREAYLLHDLYSMSPLRAIEAATANGPNSLGPWGLAPLTGQLRSGYDADVIALNASPLDDMKVLRDSRETVTHVWKAGTLYKQPDHHHH
eukprot:TRINITY_DN2457_c0_g2_i1.p1 TRINITY_DN2457_c0_g2~~TRINITY_DN2457_c0_g2_i1.p1  ORF type:complete len:465 (+),score=158.71 TRINITY_DN2457_c0_g2_i1:55-1449(+)